MEYTLFIHSNPLKEKQKTLYKFTQHGIGLSLVYSQVVMFRRKYIWETEEEHCHVSWWCMDYFNWAALRNNRRPLYRANRWVVINVLSSWSSGRIREGIKEGRKDSSFPPPLQFNPLFYCLNRQSVEICWVRVGLCHAHHLRTVDLQVPCVQSLCNNSMTSL